MISKVIDNATKYISIDEDLELIRKAYDLAFKYHDGQFRKSGEPYIVHPVEVAYILTEIQAGPFTIVAGILHDIIEDTELTYDDIAHEFNHEVADIVEGVTKISELSKYKKVTQEENHKKIIEAVSDDIRVIIVKLCDRLHNIRTLNHLKPEKQKKIAKETLELYAPFANRLGMYKIKSELEDTSFMYNQPEDYERTKELIKKEHQNRVLGIEVLMNDVNSLLPDYEVRLKGRAKSTYSVYNKMKSQNLTIKEIYDLSAIRIVVNELNDCYKVLGIIHTHFTPISGKFKDYIALPKENMYQSIHTTIFGKDKKVYEIQIRTKEMDDVAEFGIAAHWAYKEGDSLTKEEEQNQLQERFSWYKEIINYRKLESTHRYDYINTVKSDILSYNIQVYTPKGKKLFLPYKSTPIDFAYKIHTSIGEKAISAFVNDKEVDLFYELKDGDYVNIITNEDSFGPTEEWLKFTKSVYAKNRISTFLKRKNKSLKVSKGKYDFVTVLENTNHDLATISDDDLNDEFFRHYNIKTLEDLYEAIGIGTVDATSAYNRIYNKDGSNILELVKEKPLADTDISSDNSLSIATGITPGIKRASCCNPLPGEETKAVYNDKKILVVHSSKCEALNEVNSEKVLDIAWTNVDNKKYKVRLLLIFKDRDGILGDVVSCINRSTSVLVSIMAGIENQSSDGFYCDLTIHLRNSNELDIVVNDLTKIEGIVTIKRRNII